MQVELSPEECQNLIVFINAHSAQGQVQEVAVMLKQKLARAMQEPTVNEPSRDGATEEVPAESN
jgi:hypothetical protein